MAQSIGWSLSAKIEGEGRPILQAEGVVEIEAVEKISVVVPAKKTLKVTVAPGKWQSVSLLIIHPSVTDGTLKYTVKSTGPVYTLDATHSLIGAGAVSLLDKDANAVLEFKIEPKAGEVGKDAKVDILVGRDATPGTP